MKAAAVVIAAALSRLQGLQVLQRTSNAKGSAVEVAPPQLKWEQEFAGQHQFLAPGREGASANS